MTNTRYSAGAVARNVSGAALLALIFVFGAAARVQAHSEEVAAFVPEPGSLARISVDADLVTVTLASGATISEEKIMMETEQPISVQVADYNFDGHPDFSLSHTDDGKGTYQIYQIYVFAPTAHKFVPLTPGCGDGFINVVLSKPRQRRLTNSYVADGTWKTCTKKY